MRKWFGLLGLLLVGCGETAVSPLPPRLLHNLPLLGLATLLLAVALALAVQWRARAADARNRELALTIAERTSEIERRRQIAEGLREILIILNSNRSLSESLHYIVNQAARLTEAEDAILFRHGAERPFTIVATNSGGQIQYEPGFALLALTAPWLEADLGRKRPLIIGDLAQTAAQDRLGSHRALLGVPLFVGDAIYGGLIMFYTQPRSFSEEDLDLGATFADQAALAIANERLRAQAEETAVLSERNRLARDLHDAVSQTLFSASLIAEALPALWQADPEEGAAMLGELRQLTRGALAEMRGLLLELRPTALAEAQLDDLLRQLAEAAGGRTGVPITVQAAPVRDVPAAVHEALYRIGQEALNNVVKHAQATAVTVQLDQRNGRVTLSVEDNGRGFDPRHANGSSLGLTIMQERAQAIGAQLTVAANEAGGTLVTAVWPAVE